MEELKLLGLKDIEIKVYITLLKLNQALASEIAKKSKIPRVSIYDILRRLKEEGLVSQVIKDNKKYFSAANPETIIENLDFKKRRILEIIPNLKKIQEMKDNTPQKVELYEGKKGLQTILSLILQEKEFFAIGVQKNSINILPYFIEKWEIERKKRKIKGLIIYNDTFEIRENVKKANYPKEGWRYRFLKGDYASPVITIVFGDKIVLGSWEKEN
jgi:sugar-specific transcriptional regulator TrmB